MSQITSASATSSGLIDVFRNMAYDVDSNIIVHLFRKINNFLALVLDIVTNSFLAALTKKCPSSTATTAVHIKNCLGGV